MLHGTVIAPDESQFAVSTSKFPGIATGSAAAGGDVVVIPDAFLLFNCEFKRVGDDLKLIGEDGRTHTVPDYFKGDKHPTLATAQGAQIPAAVIDALAGGQREQYAQAGAQPGVAEAIGKVATVTGNATIVRNGVAVTVNAGDVVLKNDVLRTGGDGALGVTFNDGTTFSLSANAQMSVNEFVYQDGGANNQAVFNLVRGSISFFASQVAKTGDMKVSTPTATMGIRGTTVVVDITVNTQTGNIGQVQIKLYADANGNVGRVEVFSNTGQPLGTLTATATGFVITPGQTQPADAQQVSQQDAARDLALLQQLFNSTNIGNQLLQQGGPNDNPQPNSNPNTNGSNGSSTNPSVIITVDQTQAGPGTTTTTVTGVTINPPATTTTDDDGGQDDTDDDTPAPVIVETENVPTVNTIVGSDESEYIEGTPGVDVIFAGGGNDTVYALGSDDQVYGEDGDDLIVGGSGAGNDLYDGGGGNDTVSYGSTTQGVIVDLDAGTATGFEIGTDTLVDIENATGGSGGDLIAGTEGANVLDGGGGHDEIDGHGGDDTMVGGEGNDTIFVHDGGEWSVDGGAGIDRIVFVGEFDSLSDEGGPEAGNVEIVDMNSTHDNEVDFDAEGIAEMNDAGVLRVLGSSGDVVNIGGGDEDWHPDGYWRLAEAGVAYEDDDATPGVLFNKFEFVSYDEDEEDEIVVATVWLEQGIQSDLYDLVSEPSASDDTAGMTENQVLFVDALANDDSAGSNPATLQSLGAIAIEGPDGVTLGTPAIVIENNQIRVTPGTAFDALAEGETATITIPYTMQNGDGATATAVATVTVTGSNDAPYFSTRPEGFQSIGSVSGSSSFGGIEAVQIITEGATAAEIETFLGLDAGTLAAASAQDAESGARLNPTNGAAVAFDLELAAGETVTVTWNFVSAEYEPFNDFAFFSLAPNFGEKLADIFAIGDGANDGVLHSSGWQEYSYTADVTGEHRLGLGVVNTGDTAFNSFLYISGFSGLGFTRSTSEDGGIETFDLLNGALDVDTNDILVAVNVVTSATDQNGDPVDVADAVAIEGNSVTIDPTFFNYLAAGESVAVVVHYGVSDGHTITNNTATLVVAGADDELPNTAPATDDVAAQGSEDASAIAVALEGTDPEDGEITTFRITSLPDHGTLYAQDVSASMVAVTLNQLVDLGDSKQFFFVPENNWSGETAFTYAAVDSDEAQDQTPATATITVNAVNDAPATDAVQASGIEDQPNRIAIVLSGDDVDGTVTTFRITGGIADGTLYTSAEGGAEILGNDTVSAQEDGTRTVYFQPNADFSGQVTIEYAAIDNQGLQDESPATATIDVAAANDAPALDDTALAAIEAGTADPQGDTIANLFTGKFDDVDAGSSFAGIAVTQNEADAETQGYWQYWCEGVNVWLDIGLVSPATALALSANTLIRFLPAQGFAGTPSPLLVHALDDTYGGEFTYAGDADRVLIDATINGGSTAISDQAAEIGTTVMESGPAVVTGTVLTDGGFDLSTIVLGIAEGDFLGIFPGGNEGENVIRLDLFGIEYQIATLGLDTIEGENEDDIILTGGTITGLHILDETGGLFEASGFHIPAVDLMAALEFYDSNEQNFGALDALFDLYTYSMTGRAGPDTIGGGLLNDTIGGGGGADLMEGDGGDDVFLVRDAASWTVAGGAGVDTLRFEGEFDILDDYDTQEGGDGPDVAGIEIIDMNEDTANIVDIDVEGVMDMLALSELGTLRVLGGGNDEINLNNNFWNPLEGAWEPGQTGVSFDEDDDYTDGVVFNEYIFIDGETPLATIYVQQGIQANLG
jgi:hypothetical protein